MSESKRMFNQKRGGKLDSRDFYIEIKNPNGFVNVEMNNYVNVSLPPKVGRRRSTNITAQQNFQTQPVPPKELIKKGLFSTYEPYIFFGYDPEKGKYRFVCYNQFGSKTPIFRKLEDNDEISRELTLEQIKNIGNPTLLQLFCFLNKKTTNRGDGVLYMERLQRYLIQHVGVRIPESDYC